MAHGEWLPWLESQADVPGFPSYRTAQRLIKAAANTSPASHLEAIDLSRQMWGNKEILEDAKLIRAERTEMGSQLPIWTIPPQQNGLNILRG